ncbi:MAG: hypothetical protein LIP02_11320 [Bacteroidales bacterium]|nr:hypothetical protein [Bacteroidales bacterium]
MKRNRFYVVTLHREGCQPTTLRFGNFNEAVFQLQGYAKHFTDHVDQKVVWDNKCSFSVPAWNVKAQVEVVSY